MALCRDADLSLWIPQTVAALGAAYTLGNRLADAISLLIQAIERTITTETASFQTQCRLSLGEAQMLAGRLEEAHALAEGALALANRHQEQGNRVYALHLLGQIAVRRDPPECEQAESHYQQALALAEELGMRPLQAHCYLSLGTLYTTTTGRWEQARSALAAAIALYYAMAMTFWLPQAEAALAEVEGH
jgi:tetratricopeptide (TPR) repeat protein